MAYTFEHKQLTTALKLAKLASDNRASLPAFNAVQFAATESNNAVIRASDSDLWLTYQVPNSMGFDGESAAFPLPELTKLCAACERGDLIRIDSDTFTSGDMKAQVACIARDMYPEFPKARESALHYTFTAKHLLPALESVSVAMSDEETRYYLRGIYLERIDNFSAQLTATDGHRLLTETIESFAPLDRDPESDFIGHIIPAKAVKALVELIKIVAADEVISLSVDSLESKAQLTATASGWQLSFAAVDNHYPHYRRVIPTDKNLSVINSESLTKAAVKITKLHKGAIKLDLESGAIVASGDSVKSLSVKIESRSTDHCDPCPNIGFNVAYIAPLVKALCADEIYISAENAESPALLFPAESARKLKAVLMPMRH